MILSICMRCASIYNTKEHGKPGMQFSHGYCRACAQTVLAEALHQAEHENSVEMETER
jgi:hypothetical protein